MEVGVIRVLIVFPITPYGLNNDDSYNWLNKINKSPGRQPVTFEHVNYVIILNEVI